MTSLEEIRAAAQAFRQTSLRFDACIERLQLEAAAFRASNDGLAAILQRARAGEVEPCPLSPLAHRA
ncbi:hypothetical protein [Kaistia sp. MMO-174]|uniref:hypothetical protein n=1 Tax=Kaistia sp. MMO-174 TaxID=3081256 RepID=UPI003016A313